MRCSSRPGVATIMLASTLDGLPEPPMISADVTGVYLPSASTTCVMQGDP